ncbi:MAG: PHP domain-containing protein [Firmicutes bacterium]|nr:PHP domain-containing protein [Bacillota bacterium]
MCVDLHIHTTASDGLLSPQQVVGQAVDLGLRAIAITDHDIIDGCSPAITVAGEKLEVIPGIEINTEWKNKEVHVLGYFIDLEDQQFLQTLKELRQARLNRIGKIVRKLRQLGLNIELSRVLELAGAGTIGRPHIAIAMIEQGYVETIQEAFTNYIGYGAPAYVPRYKLSPSEAVEIIRRAKGIPVLAHPGLIGSDELIPDLVKIGLQGLEVFYPEHDPEQTEHYLRLARYYNLAVTGGSDFHGNSSDYRGELGGLKIDYSVVEKLRALKTGL